MGENRENFANSDREENSTNVKNICTTIWDAIRATDKTPEQDFVEVYFGVGAIWDGVQNKTLQYQLTSIRHDTMVLISQNLCEDICSDNFPRCYRFTSANLCGKPYERSLNGVKSALHDLEKIHDGTPTRAFPMWAVLLLYDESGSETILERWYDISDPLVRCDAPERSARDGARFAQWWNRYQSTVYIILGVIAIVLVVFILSIVTRRTKKSDSEQKETRDKAQEARDREALEQETLAAEKDAESSSWYSIPGTESPRTI